jgi:anaerobic selenocysteine-containing dehydrogenase
MIYIDTGIPHDLINQVDINKIGLDQGETVTLKNDTGAMSEQKVMAYPIKQGNIMVYYPESNNLVPLKFDPQPKTSAFKSIEVFLEKQL